MTMPDDLLNAAPAAPADPAAAPAVPAAAPAAAAPAEPAAPAAAPTAAEPPKPAEPVEYKFSAPEGAQLDDALLGAYSETAKELNLSQEHAQKLLDKMAPAMAARHIELVDAERKAWREESSADSEFGGEKLNENLAIAKRGLEFAGSEKLQTLLNESGLGNHPEVIRAFWKVGKVIGEDGRPVTGVPTNTQATLAKRLYNKSNMS